MIRMAMMHTLNRSVVFVTVIVPSICTRSWVDLLRIEVEACSLEKVGTACRSCRGAFTFNMFEIKNPDGHFAINIESPLDTRTPV